MLTEYQQAILQEMGIGLLEPQSSSSNTQSESKSSTSPVVAKSENPLAQLRQQIKPKPEIKPEVKATPVEATKVRNDIELVLLELKLISKPQTAWTIAEDSLLAINSEGVFLSKQTKDLSGKEKRQLWQKIIDLSA